MSIAEIRARLAATTQGKWQNVRGYGDYGSAIVCDIDGEGWDITDDAGWIAQAHNEDMPALLAALDAATAELDRLRAEGDEWAAASVALRRKMEKATAECDKVRDEAANLLMEKLRLMLANDSLRTERGAAQQRIAELEGLCRQARKAAAHYSCLHDDPDPTWHCCDDAGLVDVLDAALTAASGSGKAEGQAKHGEQRESE